MKSKSNKLIDYSIVIPVYQNKGSLDDTFKLPKKNVIDRNPQYSAELIFVDDGSTDGSFQDLVNLYEAYPELIVIVKLTRNFGTYPAIIAGFNQAKGKCIINLSADLQEPPELIHDMLQYHFNKNYSIVICARESRDEGIYKKITSKIFYGVIKKLCFPKMPIGGFDFCLISERVKDEILKNLEADFFLQGKILSAGYNIKYIPYTRRKREIGKSQWTFSMKLKWFIDSLMSYSFFPIRFMSAFGIILSFIGFLYAIVVFIERVYGGVIDQRAPIVILILILSGFQILMLGVIGEYVWRTLSQVRNRPKYMIDEIIE